MLKVLPFPRAVEQSILPPCSLMTCWAYARPRPVPSPFVVKNGTKRFRASSSVMPRPLSLIYTRASAPFLFALTVRFPPQIHVVLIEQRLHKIKLFLKPVVQRKNSALRLRHPAEPEILLENLMDSQHLQTHFAQKHMAFI